MTQAHGEIFAHFVQDSSEPTPSTTANTPIQGSAADLCKLAMLKITDELREVQIHDELVLEAPELEVDRASEVVRRHMQSVYPLTGSAHTSTSSAAAFGTPRIVTFWEVTSASRSWSVSSSEVTSASRTRDVTSLEITSTSGRGFLARESAQAARKDLMQINVLRALHPGLADLPLTEAACWLGQSPQGGTPAKR